MHPDWIVPDWPAPARVKAFITTRAGGVSAGPYASFNLGYTTGDDESAIRTNRERLRALLPEEPRWLKQVHGARVMAAESIHGRPEADASFANTAGHVCAIQIADCLPVLFTDRGARRVAAAHAGWRGLAAGVIDNTVAAMTASGVDAADLLAYIGPGIGPTAFEVGQDVFDAYTKQDPDAASAFAPIAARKWLANLCALARRSLARCGVMHVYGGSLCTYSNPERFYSYRRDKVTGRMGAFIWME
jgi:YfiH family protein